MTIVENSTPAHYFADLNSDVQNDRGMNENKIMDTFQLEEQILDKWPQGQILPDGFLKGSERKTLQGIAIMLGRMDVTPDLEQATRNLLDKGDLRGHIDDFMTIRKNNVDRMIQFMTPSFNINIESAQPRSETTE